MVLDRSSELRLALAAILFSGVEPFSNSGRRSPKEHFYVIILKSGLWHRRRCHLKKKNFYF